MLYFLGVDGGGTRSTAAVCDESGKTVARYEGGALNYTVIGLDIARDNLRALLLPALSDPAFTVSAAALCLAALNDRATHEETRRICGGILPDIPVLMHSDVYAALCAVSVGGAAAAAICGTGSMAAGREEDGTSLYAGGWGPLIGDEGSGYRISLDAVRAAVRGEEGSGAPTMLTQALLGHFELKTVSDCIPLFYSPSFDHSSLASFCPAVFHCADSGDDVARAIIEDALSSFADTVGVVLKRLPKGTPLGLWGGLFQNREDYRRRFARLISARFPFTNTDLLSVPPCVGAARAAYAYYKESGRNGSVQR